MVIFWVCSTQNANAQSENNEQRIIGTWVDEGGGSWVFNANGTLKRGDDLYKFGVTSTMLAIIFDEDDLS
jgi:uncharacterized lipoprotein YddW (UPF0748 family)